jgi:hypothetical protein
MFKTPSGMEISGMLTPCFQAKSLKFPRKWGKFLPAGQKDQK